MIHYVLATWRGRYNRLCVHRSHRLRMPCWWLQISEGFCSKHNGTCWTDCRKETLCP